MKDFMNIKLMDLMDFEQQINVLNNIFVCNKIHILHSLQCVLLLLIQCRELWELKNHVASNCQLISGHPLIRINYWWY